MKKTTLFRLAMAQANPQEFARQFPCAGNRAIEHSFHFRDVSSWENFEAAKMGLELLPWKTRQPITIITGPPASGKSTLARVIAAALGDPEPHRVMARSARLLEADLVTACKYKLKTIIIEDISESLLCASASEWRLMTSSVPWVVRPLGTSRVEEITHRPWLILTINSPLIMPADLARRARIIELTTAENAAAAA
jgi:hypothetical protein